MQSLELKCKVVAAVFLVHRQARNYDLSRPKLLVVLLLSILDHVKLILMADLLHTCSHTRDACLIDLLLQHTLIVLELYCGFLKLRLIARGVRKQSSLLVLTWLDCGQVEH